MLQLTSSQCKAYTHTHHTHHFNSHLPGKPRQDSQSPVILILSIVMGEAKTIHTLFLK